MNYYVIKRLVKALGYSNHLEGICAFYAEKAVDACLSEADEGLTPLFNRIRFINENHYEIPEMYDEIRKKLKSPTANKHLTAHELAVLDVVAFIEQGLLYQTPNYYDDIFTKSIIQQDSTRISYYAQPEMLASKGGRVQLSSFIGNYDNNLLKKYFSTINNIASQATSNFAITIANHNHRISVCYMHAIKTWVLIDSNQRAIGIPANNEYTLTFEKFIRTAFENKPVIQFTSVILAANDNKAHLEPLIQEFIHNPEFLQLLTDDNNDRNTLQIAIANNSFFQLKLSIKTEESNKKIPLNLNNAIDDYGNTPAFYLAFYDNLSMLDLLMETKDDTQPSYVDLNIESNVGCTVAFIAAAQNQVNCLESLIQAKNTKNEHRVNLNTQTASGVTLAYVASQKGHIEILKLLIDAKNDNGECRVDLDKTTKYGWAPLHSAACNDEATIIQLLVGAANADKSPRVDLNKLINETYSPADTACEHGGLSAMKVLFENNANLNALKHNDTLLQTKTLSNHLLVSRFLKAWNKRNSNDPQSIEEFENEYQSMLRTSISDIKPILIYVEKNILGELTSELTRLQSKQNKNEEPRIPVLEDMIASIKRSTRNYTRYKMDTKTFTSELTEAIQKGLNDKNLQKKQSWQTKIGKILLNILFVIPLIFYAGFANNENIFFSLKGRTKEKTEDVLLNVEYIPSIGSQRR